jgi:hypothetical protein
VKNLLINNFFFFNNINLYFFNKFLFHNKFLFCNNTSLYIFFFLFFKIKKKIYKYKLKFNIWFKKENLFQYQYHFQCLNNLNIFIPNTFVTFIVNFNFFFINYIYKHTRINVKNNNFYKIYYNCFFINKNLIPLFNYLIFFFSHRFSFFYFFLYFFKNYKSNDVIFKNIFFLKKKMFKNANFFNKNDLFLFNIKYI